MKSYNFTTSLFTSNDISQLFNIFIFLFLSNDIYIGVEADPLEISIDVIEVKFYPPPTAPRQKLSDTMHKNLLHTHTHGYGHVHGMGYGHSNSSAVDKEGVGVGYSQADDDNNSLQFTGFNRDGSR